MHPTKSETDMKLKFEKKEDNTVSIYTQDENGKKNEIVRMDVWSKDEVETFRAITSSKQFAVAANQEK